VINTQPMHRFTIMTKNKTSKTKDLKDHNKPIICQTPAEALTAIKTIYNQSIDALRNDLEAYLLKGILPNPQKREARRYGYPQLSVEWKGENDINSHTNKDTEEEQTLNPKAILNRAFARFSHPGRYTTTLTRPEMFEDYISEQLSLLNQDYNITITVSRSSQEIPYPYVLDGAGLDLNLISSTTLAQYFPTTELALIGNEIADGIEPKYPDGSQPLALFDGLRSDFSIARLKHYTGTAPKDIQSYILMTNYHRYVDAFVAYALEQLAAEDSPYEALSCCGDVLITKDTPNALELINNAPWRKHQMPAYHLLRSDKKGISLINIGVGPSNAKNITDHLAVMRPHAWVMIGHCGGLRPSQSIGDYVLAHAYLRDDHIMDEVLPPEIPIPAIAEVQQALSQAALMITGEDSDNLKKRLRTGTVVTTDDRNWELRYKSSALRFSQSRAVAIDMESATLAAQGYRFRVPYGTLLCVSDKPLHGEIKLPGQANHFYERAIREHINIGIATMSMLRDFGAKLHSRKLRAFDEPPFR